MSDHTGQFVWHELITTDADAALAFYGKVVGWTWKDAGVPGMRYDLLHTGDVQVGGVMAVNFAECPGAGPGWMGYIACTDVDAFADRVGKAGGKTMMGPQDIPNVGRFAVVADPQGAPFVLFRDASGSEPPKTEMGAPGSAAWCELYADDWQAAFDFYSGLFGWSKADAMDMGEMGTYQIFARGDAWVGGMMNRPENVPAPFWLYYFHVEHIGRAAERIKQAGGSILWGPDAVPGGFALHGLDPQGAMFGLFGPRPE